MKIAIVGTGYVGLTTGVALAYLGHEVSCLDVDENKIEQLNNGRLPFHEPGLETLLSIAEDNLHFISKYTDARLDKSSVIFIAVGTPPLPDGGPNLSFLRSAAEAIGSNLGEGFTVVVNKSTVPIGSGNWVGAIIRDSFEARNGRRPDGKFAVASNPEFLREGSALFDSFYPDRIVVGAEEEKAIEILTALYRPILNQDFAPPTFLPRPEGLSAVTMVTTDLASAELIKYAANAFLALKISYINEIAQLSEKVGADIKQIARGIGLDERIGSRFLNAGIGWGGSCFGKDTAALLSAASDYGMRMPIVHAARETNYRQRHWVVEKLQSELHILRGRTICLLGLAFKPGTDDLRDSPAIDIARYLMERGASVRAFDPIALGRARVECGDMGIRFYESVLEASQEVDAIVLTTEWPEFLDLPWSDIREGMATPLILDGRNFLSARQIESLGFRYVGVGRSTAARLIPVE
jgi:UDPglucose 6-dehydrogenase